MSGDSPALLKRARSSITSAVDLGASTADVMLATVQGLRGHDHPSGTDRADSRQLAGLYPKLLGSGAEGEPSMFELLDDEPEQMGQAGASDDAASPSHGDVAGSTEGAPVSPIGRPKRHYPHRRAMTLRLPEPMWRRLRQAALDNDTNASDVIRAALERHLAHLDGQKTRRSAS